MNQKTAVQVPPTNDLGIAQSIVPYNRDDNRAKYLGYRCCGFTATEALQLTGVVHGTLTFWRHDQEFVDLEGKLPELRATLGVEYTQLDFLRNFRMFLKKDYEIITKGINYPDGMSDRDFQYLLKARSQYTPQQLSIIEALAKAQESGIAFDFTGLVLKLSQEKRTLEIKGKKDEMPQLPSTDEED